MKQITTKNQLVKCFTNKIFKKVILIITIIIFFGCKSISKDAEEIVKIVKEVCDCETIDSLTIVGVAISTERDSSSGDRHEITLKNCKGDINEQTKLIQKALLEKDSLCEDKYIVLSFENEENSMRTYIDDCKAILK